MATTNIPKNVKRMAKFNFISSNYVSSVSTHANTPTPINKLMEVLHDGITSKQGTYGAVLLVGGTTAYIEFKVEEDFRFWATSGVYSDSGGASGAELNIYKYNNELQTYQLFKTVPTTATEDWYVVCDLLTKGTYKIQAKGNYVQFNEFYFESIVENKTFILHDGKYKKWNERKLPTKGISILPAFTSNTKDGVTASSNGNSGTNYPYKALDKNTSTCWISDVVPSVSKPVWLMIDLGKPIVLSGYGISIYARTTYNINTHYFQGSNNGVDFETIHSRVGQPLTETLTYTDFQPTSFRYYRVLITQHSGSSGQVSIQELELIGEGTYLEEGFWSTVSKTIPNSQQFLEKGMGNLSTIPERRLETLQPISMTYKSEILGVGGIGKVFSKTIDLKKYFDIRKIRTEVK